MYTYANNCREIGALQIFFNVQQTFPLCFLEVLEFSYFFAFAKTDLCAHVFRTYDVVIVLLLSSRALVIHDLQFHDCFAGGIYGKILRTTDEILAIKTTVTSYINKY